MIARSLNIHQSGWLVPHETAGCANAYHRLQVTSSLFSSFDGADAIQPTAGDVIAFSLLLLTVQMTYHRLQVTSTLLLLFSFFFCVDGANDVPPTAGDVIPFSPFMWIVQMTDITDLRCK